jgi:hypothetical protein
MTTMPTRILIFAFTTAAVMAMVPYARPQDADQGQIEFLLNCAGCHGTDAKGSGPQSAKLHIKPADLTVLAKRSHGRFDPGAVYQMIDGRNARLSHHSAEMPIWGCRHQTPLPDLPSTTKRKIDNLRIDAAPLHTANSIAVILPRLARYQAAPSIRRCASNIRAPVLS